MFSKEGRQCQPSLHGDVPLAHQREVSSNSFRKSKKKGTSRNKKNQLGTTQIQSDSVVEDEGKWLLKSDDDTQQQGTFNWTSKLKQKQDENAPGATNKGGCCGN